MRACFTNFVTIRGTTSKSGLYINDLPGIPIDLINKLRTKDSSSLSEFWSRFYERSVYTFLGEISNYISKKFYANEVVESRVSGEFTSDTNSTGETYAGVLLDLPESRYVENQILTLKFNVVSIGSPNTASIYIFDNEGGTLLQTEEVTDIATGINTVNFYNVFDQDKLYIAYKPSEMTVKQTKSYDRYYDDQDTLTSINQINNGGVIVEINNFCSLEKLVCSRLYALRYAFWFHLGVELMKERVLTNEINKYTHLTIEKAEQLGAVWEQDFKKKVEAAFKHVKLNDDKLCTECRGVVSIRKSLP